MPTDGQQTTLPGTDTVLGTYECGYDRTHQVPSDDVFLLKTAGAGFTGVCRCGLSGDTTLQEVISKPQRLGPHWTMLGGTDLSPAFWMALDDAADGGSHENPDELGTSFGDPSYAERRKEYREKMCAEVEVDG